MQEGGHLFRTLRLLPPLPCTVLPDRLSRQAATTHSRCRKGACRRTEAGLEAARPGNTAGDIARALAKPLEAAGIERGARAGYPIGISYPPDWGERTISIRDEDTTELRPGMTFHFMPGLWMDGWGLEITESILIRDGSRAECLCNRPRELFVKA